MRRWTDFGKRRYKQGKKYLRKGTYLRWVNTMWPTYEQSCSLPVVQDFQSALSRSSAALQEKFLKVSDFAVNILCPEGPAASGNERKLVGATSDSIPLSDDHNLYQPRLLDLFKAFHMSCHYW
jgi:hypothetical protein